MAPAQAAYLQPGSQEVLITMADGSTARAVIQAPGTVASLN